MPESLHVPDDLETCQQLLRDLSSAYQQLQQVYQELLSTCSSIQDAQWKLEQQKEELELQIKELTHRLYGRRSERDACSPRQMSLNFGEGDVVEVLPDVGEEEEFVAQHEAKQRHPAARCRGRNSTVAGPACVLSPSGRQS